MDLRALVFMPALVGAVVFGFVFLLYACNYYLTVLESTAAGAKEVTWISEPITDNFGKFWYLAWLVGLWFGPAYLVGRAAAGAASPWTTLLIPVAVLWVCYPVSQLSSLSASSPWIPLVPDVFARLGRKPLVVLQFLALSAGVLALLAVAFRWTFQLEGSWELLFAGAPLLVVSGLLYARLIGRLAFVLRFTKGLFSARRKKKPKDEEPRQKPDGARPRPRQPSDMDPILTPEGELGGYDVRFEDEPPPTPKKRVRAEVAESEGEPAGEPEPATPPRGRRPAPETAAERGRARTDEDDEEAAPYGVREAEGMSDDARADVPQPTADDLRLLDRSDAPRKPKRAWGPDLLAFLAQPQTLSAVLIASGFCTAAGAMVRIARVFNPVGGPG